MPKKTFVSPVLVDGLRGRVLYMPGPKDTAREVLFVYGHHSSIERWRGIAELMSKHAHITMPDLPGFGAAESLYKKGRPATLNNLADWLASFIVHHYRGQRFTVVGMSLGFVIVTRMLQRHPEITGQVVKLISLFGFAHKDDFILSAKSRRLYLLGARVFALPLTSNAYRWLFLNSFVLSRAYHKTPNAAQKFKDNTPKQHAENMAFEIKLWQGNDLRTYMKTSSEFLTLDNTKQKVNLPVRHIGVASDRYFDNKKVATHLRKIFKSYHLIAELQTGSHAPTRVATAKDAEILIPEKLLKEIA